VEEQIFFSVDLPWVVGINLKLAQAKYKELSVGGNILQDSGIGGVKARQFVVVTVAQNGLAGDITFLGKKPHNMELFLGVTDHSMQQKCFSEVRLDKEVACSSVNSEFADALKSGCLNCPLSGPFNPQIQNMIAAEPDGRPDNVLDEVKLGEILDADTLKTMSDFSLGLVDESSKIALDAVVDSFDDLDLDGIVAEVEREVLSEEGKLEDTLTKAIAGTSFVDLDDLIKKIPKLVMDIEDIIGDIESIVSSWDLVKGLFD